MTLDYCSYLLRLWQTDRPENSQWRVTLEDLKTHEIHRFNDVSGLLEFINTHYGAYKTASRDLLET